MEQDLSIVLWMIGLAVLLGPLCYAILTLRGMREKVLYPLLRLRKPDGGQTSVIELKRLGSVGRSNGVLLRAGI